MKILVANLGSTSLKWRLFDFADDGQEWLLHKGGYERVTNYSQAISDCLAQLKSGSYIRRETDLAAVGFKTIMARGVNGCVGLNDGVLEAMEACNHIAPAHNPPYVTGIRLFAQRMPTVPLVGLFETAFYQWMPPAMTRYAVPEAWHAMGIRRWGFHGASHKYIAERSAELAEHQEVVQRARQLYVGGASTPTNPPDLRVISCHLGGSSSITAILNGVAVGTSMGFSPQSGLPQNNRVGDLDAFALPFLMRSTGMSLEDAEVALCTESGLKGLSGGYNDFRDIEEQANQGNLKAELALGVFVQQARHWIGSFLAQLNGADALVFTAGIGENRPALRSRICANLDQLGIYLDEHANQNTIATEGLISPPDWPVKVIVIPTNEELVVAREVKRYLEKLQAARPTRTATRKAQTGKPAASFSKLKSKLKQK